MHNDSSNLLNITGTLHKGACVVIIRTEWNEPILQALEDGCREVLRQVGVENIITLSVPGAVEIPFAIQAHASCTKGKNKADAYIALGCVIKGDTPHFDYVCSSVTMGITQLNLQLKSPVIYGVLTVNNEEQAWQRLGGSHGHKGKEAAAAAIKMIQLKKSMREKK